MGNASIRQDILQSVPHWLQQGTLEQEWQRILGIERIALALRELEHDVFFFTDFFATICNQTALPGVGSSWFSDIFKECESNLFDLLDGGSINPTKQPQCWMAVRLLLDLRHPTCAAGGRHKLVGPIVIVSDGGSPGNHWHQICEKCGSWVDPRRKKHNP